MDNFTAIPNELFESDFWNESKLSHQAAFIDLFRMRRNSPTMIEVRGYPVEIETDQGFVSLDRLTKRWNVSKNTVRRYLKIFEKTRLIKREGMGRGQIITFLCFTRCVSKSDTLTDTQTNTQTDPIKDVKKNKKNKRVHYKEKDFRKSKTGLWIAYCSGCGKQHFPKDHWELLRGSACCGQFIPNRPEIKREQTNGINESYTKVDAITKS